MTASKPRLPQQAAGHWDSDDGHEMATQYVAKSRGELFMGDVSDLALANAQFLVSRQSLELIHYQTAAKERIRWLSAQLVARDELLRKIHRMTHARVGPPKRCEIIRDWIEEALSAGGRA